VLTEAPVEAPPRPLLASALSWAFWAALLLAVLALELLVLELVPVVVVLVVLGVLAAGVVLVLAVLAVLGVVDVMFVLLLLASRFSELVLATTVFIALLAGLPLVPAAALPLAALALIRKSLTAAADDWVPVNAPPVVLTQTSLSVSGLCQKLGSTSITT
jgi:hypothetical protein